VKKATILGAICTAAFAVAGIWLVARATVAVLERTLG
jgi:hypothetical protein